MMTLWNYCCCVEKSVQFFDKICTMVNWRDFIKLLPCKGPALACWGCIWGLFPPELTLIFRVVIIPVPQFLFFSSDFVWMSLSRIHWSDLTEKNVMTRIFTNKTLDQGLLYTIKFLELLFRAFSSTNHVCTQNLLHWSYKGCFYYITLYMMFLRWATSGQARNLLLYSNLS